MTRVHHITFKRGDIKESVIEDAQRADDWPDSKLHGVVVHPDEITVEGTPDGIRWLFDWFNWAADAHRAEGGQWHGDVCESMANTIWEAVDGDLPDRQRPRRRIR